MTCNGIVWIVVGINLTGLAINLYATWRAHKSWNKADEALKEAIRARLDALNDLLKHQGDRSCSTTTTLN